MTYKPLLAAVTVIVLTTPLYAEEFNLQLQGIPDGPGFGGISEPNASGKQNQSSGFNNTNPFTPREFEAPNTSGTQNYNPGFNTNTFSGGSQNNFYTPPSTQNYLPNSTQQYIPGNNSFNYPTTNRFYPSSGRSNYNGQTFNGQVIPNNYNGGTYNGNSFQGNTYNGRTVPNSNYSSRYNGNNFNGQSYPSNMTGNSYNGQPYTGNTSRNNYNTQTYSNSDPPRYQGQQTHTNTPPVYNNSSSGTTYSNGNSSSYSDPPVKPPVQNSYSQAQIKLKVPSHCQGQCQYTLIDSSGKTYDYTMTPGHSQTFAESSGWSIRYRSGNSFQTYRLRGGKSYELSNTAGSWNLYMDQ